MLIDSLSTALGGVAAVVVLVIAIYIYASLVRQISVRRLTVVDESARKFGVPEGFVASALIFILLFSIVVSSSGREVQLDSHVLLENFLVELGVVLFISALVIFRGFDVRALAGFSRISFLRAASTGAVLLLAAYPLISLSETIAQRLLGGDSSRQNIIELFSSSQAIEQRVMVIVFAVAIAPIIEEFLFRFFLYGVLKRYFGRAFGIVFNSLLFGAVHGHLPSLAPLFVLGICFTIAFEWSGSILVSMTMHALFNSLSLTLLAFPELFQA